MMDRPVPIVLFVYNRVHHIIKVLDSIKKAKHGKETPLIIVSDGYKGNDDKNAVLEVRDYINSIEWQAGKRIIESPVNKGVGKIIPESLSLLFKENESLIIIEDDIEIGEDALVYFNEALDKFSGSNEVYSVSGFIEPITNDKLPEYFLYPLISCWGWATWADKWNAIELDSYKLLSRLYEDPDGLNRVQEMPLNLVKDLVLNCEGIMNTWAVKWAVSVVLQNGLALSPNRSFVRNIGHDETGTHCNDTDFFNIEELKEFIDLNASEVSYSGSAFNVVKHFYGNPKKGNESLFARIFSTEFKQLLKYVISGSYRNWSRRIQAINRLDRYKQYSFNWDSKIFTVLDKNSFLTDYKIFFQEELISSFDFEKGQILDLSANEGVLVKFFSRNYPDLELNVSKQSTKNLALLKENLKKDELRYLEEEELDNWFSNQDKIEFIRLTDTKKDLELFKANVSKIRHFLIHFNILKSDYRNLTEFISILERDFVLDINQFGLKDENFFKTRYRGTTVFTIVGYRK